MRIVLGLAATLGLVTLLSPVSASAQGLPPGTPSSTAVNCAPNPVAAKSSSTCAATVDGAYQVVFIGPALVTFASNGTGSFGDTNVCNTVNARSCSVSYVPSAPGPQTITASFGGSEVYGAGMSMYLLAPSSGNTLLTVTAAVSPASTPLPLPSPSVQQAPEMGRAKPTRLSTDLAGAELMNVINPARHDQLSMLTEGQVASIPPEFIGGLVGSFGRSQVQALTDDQITALAPDQLSQIVGMLDPAQVRQLTELQIQHLTSNDLGLVIGSLNPGQLPLLDASHLSRLGVDQLRQLDSAGRNQIWDRLTEAQRAQLNEP